MKGTARRIVRGLTPPFVVDMARSIRRLRRAGPNPEWRYLPGGWPDDADLAGGWNHESVPRTHRAAWHGLLERAAEPNVVSGPATAEPAEIGDLALHNTLMVYAYALGRASSGRERLSVLDWGCGSGQYAVIARGLFPGIQIDYHCRELPLLARSGRELLPQDAFYEDDLPALARHYDLVVASGSLQYVEDWQREISRLATVTRGYLFVSRLPTLRNAASFVVVHRPLGRGYQTAYPGWFVNRAHFLATAEAAGLDLVREFLIGESAHVPGAPEPPEFRAFLFAPATLRGDHP